MLSASYCRQSTWEDPLALTAHPAQQHRLCPHSPPLLVIAGQSLGILWSSHLPFPLIRSPLRTIQLVRSGQISFPPRDRRRVDIDPCCIQYKAVCLVAIHSHFHDTAVCSMYVTCPFLFDLGVLVPNRCPPDLSHKNTV